VLRTSWSTLRQSRLGILGFSIVLVFAAMAILAPIIAPYPRLFEAPLIDRFEIHAANRSLPGGQSYEGPVMGPTTPFLVDAGGGMWDINWNSSHATVYMKFLKYTLRVNSTPFDAGNLSIDFDATQMFSRSPLPSPPLSALYWIAPGKNFSFQTGPADTNGALAYFMGRDLIVGDPFSKTLIYSAQVPFRPVWTGEDPESAGLLLAEPFQNGRIRIPGLPPTPFGPYRYFYASNGTQSVVYEITYVHTGDQTLTPTGKLALTFNGSLSAPPFVYYHALGATDDDNSGFRGGPGQAILFPLANDTLAVYNVTGRVRKFVPLSLFGQPARVVAPVGYARSPQTPRFFVYLQLRSSNASAIATFDLATLKIVKVFQLPNPSLELLQAPIGHDGKALYMGFYDGSTNTTRMLGLNVDPALGNLTVASQFGLTIPGRVRSYFDAQALSSLYVYTADRKFLKVPETVRSVSQVIAEAEDFGFPIPPGVRQILYAGTFHGTLYSAALTQEELNGAWTDSSTGRTTVVTLLGRTRAPLAPGTYPSGNRYLLGTDFNGHDIWTQLLYGTQIAFIVGILAALFGVGIGTFVGVIAGYYGKLTDTLLMRTADIFLVLPFLPVVLVLVKIASSTIWIIIFVLAILGWPGIARVIRAQVLSLKERPFVDAARVAGASDVRLIFLHITPNVLPFSFLYMSLGVAAAIITEAALSYLGLGDPTVTSWGGMLSTLITLGGGLYYWWWLLPPGLAITLLSLGFYLLGRGFDEIINPRLRRR
jgi:peptide/nickel transport system permease protein